MLPKALNVKPVATIKYLVCHVYLPSKSCCGYDYRISRRTFVAVVIVVGTRTRGGIGVGGWCCNNSGRGGIVRECSSTDAA